LKNQENPPRRHPFDSFAALSRSGQAMARRKREVR